VLDDGRLTDNQGRTVDFKNTVIVMTSNIGAERIQEMAGGEYAAMKAEVVKMLPLYFRPEFINRIDETVVFHSLSREDIHEITKIQIEDIQKRLSSRKIDLILSEKALDKFANMGFDPVYGARPLKRVLRQELENPLAQEILAGKFLPNTKVHVDVAGDRVVFSG